MNQNSVLKKIFHSWCWCLMVLAVMFISGVLSQHPLQAAGKDPRADKLMVVDCLLPGQVRRLGAMRTFLTPRRPVKSTQSECEIRGGEYIEFDRADYATALKIWLPLAKQGDPEAQNYIGEIFEKGLGTESDYQAAANWYKRAAEQGYSRAQLNLGQLYELGYGVQQDMRNALNWYRRASGLDDDDLQYASSVRVTLAAKEQTIQQLQERTQRSEEKAAALRNQLDFANSELSGRQQNLEVARKSLEEIQQQLRQLKEQDSTNQATAADSKKFLKSEIEKQRAHLDTRRAKLDALEAKLKGQESSLTTKQWAAVDRNNRLQSEYLQSQAEADRLRSRLRTLNHELTVASEELSKSTSLDATMVARLKAAENERSSLKKMLTEGDQKVDLLRNDLSRARENLDVTAKKYTEARSNLEQQKILYEIDTKRLQAERDQLAQQAEMDVAEINRLRAELKGQAQLDSRRAELEALEAHLKSQESSLTTKQRKAAEQNNLLESNLLQRQAEAERFRNRLKSLNQELKVAREELSRTTTQDAAMVARLKAAENERSSLKKMLTEGDQKVDLLRNDLSRARENLDVTAAKYAEAQNNLEQRRVLYEIETKRLQEERDLLAQHAVEDVAEIGKLRAELKERESRYSEQIRNLVTKQNKGQAKVLRLEQELSVAKTSAAEVTVAASGPPSIELIEPPVSLARGAYVASVAEGMEKREIIGKVVAPAGILRLNINEQPVDFEDTGLFSQWIPISGSRTPVSLVAVDRQGQRVSLNFDLFRRIDEAVDKSADGDTPRNAKYIKGLGQYYALVIGNSNYANFTQLRTPITDAKVIAKLLKEKYGYKTTLLIDANRYEIISALNEFRKKLTKNDNMLLYYAGHGEIDDVNSQGYWLPVDSEKDNSANWISTRNVSEILNIIAAKHIMVVADSCYSGAMTRSALARLQAGKTYDEWVKWYKKVAKLRTRMVMSSGGEEPVNDGGGGKHSVFAQALIQVLGENKAMIDGYNLYLRVSKLTKQRTQEQNLDIRQSPLYAPVKYAGHEAGEYLFQRAKI